MPVIEITGLHKNFGRNKVLTGLDLAVDEGEIFGYMGENGRRGGKFFSTQRRKGRQRTQRRKILSDFEGREDSSPIDVN